MLSSASAFIVFCFAWRQNDAIRLSGVLGGVDSGTKLKIEDCGEIHTGEIRNRLERVLHDMGPVLGKRVHMRGNFEKSDGAAHLLREGADLKPPKPEEHYLLFGHDTAVSDHLSAVKSYRNISAATVNSDAINY